MTKRGKIRGFTLAAGLLLALFGLWRDARFTLKTAETRLEYSYRRALNDLTDYVSGMEQTLEKAPYVNTVLMQTQVSAKLMEQSGGAKSALAVLPLPQELSDKFSRFLSQTGDYALWLSRSSAAGKREESAAETLGLLGEYAEKLSTALQASQARLDTEKLSIGETESLLNNLEAPDDLPGFEDGFEETAEAFSQFPALLYDGPFSDHIRQREPLYLQGEPELSREEAARKAADFLDCSPEDLSFQGEGGDRLPVYSFTYGDSHVNMTKSGGKTAYFKTPSTASAAILTYEDALKAARQALRGMGFPDLKETYYVENDNLCTINFAGVLSADGMEAVCYPDLVKVTVELEEGGMVEFDAAGYLMNHRERRISPPALSEEEAAGSLSPLLDADSAALTVIPTPGLSEVLCWEFHCTAQNGKEFLVYINGETGLEEQFYLLQKSEHGVLVN